MHASRRLNNDFFLYKYIVRWEGATALDGSVYNYIVRWEGAGEGVKYI